MKTIVKFHTPEDLPTCLVEDKFGYTYFPKTGGEYRLTKDIDGELRTTTIQDLQGIVFQNDFEVDFPELDKMVPDVKIEHYSGWAALWLSYVLIVGETIPDVSTQDLDDDILMTLVDSITMGLLATEDGEWFIVPMYDKALISVTIGDDGMPEALNIKLKSNPDKIITVEV